MQKCVALCWFNLGGYISWSDSLPDKQEVIGSSPIPPTKNENFLKDLWNTDKSNLYYICKLYKISHIIMMTRLMANVKISNIISQLIYEFPDMRFMQLLMVIDAVIDTDQFNEESSVTLERIKNKIKQLRQK